MRAAFLLLIVAALTACGANQTHPGPDDSDAAALACLPNLDGRIDTHELRVVLGGPAATYLVSGGERAVDLAGDTDASGRRIWDFAGAPDDPRASLTATPIGAQWYAASFPGGEFTTPGAGGLDAVYRQDDQALWLLGLASPDEDPPEGQTLLVYADAVPVLRFPIATGASWSAVGELPAGTLRGLPYLGEDRYDVTVAVAGEVVLPELTFTQAHRVDTLVTVAPAIGAPTTRRQASFLFECFGEVVRATSRDGESATEFTTASELRRLTL